MADTLFIVSKITSFLIRVDTWILFLLLLSVWTRLKGDLTFSRRCLYSCTALIFVLSFVPVSQWILAPLENRFSRQSVDHPQGAIILGGGVDLLVSDTRGRLELNSAGDRVFAIWEISKEWPDLPIFYSGASGHLLSGGRVEAEQIRLFFEKKGLPDIFVEGVSRNTYENAKQIQRKVSADSSRPFILITSAFHMPRAIGVFRKMNLEIAPYPVDYRTSSGTAFRPLWGLGDQLETMNLAIKEWVGLLAYRILGRTEEIFPAPF